MLDDADRVHKLGKLVIDYFGASSFSGKKILDLGAGNGDLGAAFARLGASVLCVDARKENIATINKKHPFLKTMVVNLEDSFPFEERSFDFCFSFGLLSHLRAFDKHIENIVSVAENVVLETEVFDIRDSNIRTPIYEEKSVNHLSFVGEGSLISATNIQNRLSTLHATFKRVDDTKINHGQNRYDWKEQGVGRKYGNSRLYFIRRDVFWANRPAKIAPLEPRVAAPITHTQESEMPIMTRIQPNRNPPSTPIKIVEQIKSENKFRTRLFYNYYIDSNEQRKNEIDLCLSKNIDNSLFEIIILESDNPPTFNFFFDKINKLASPDDISIICNSDIFFDGTIALAKNIAPKDIYALNRWNWGSINSISHDLGDSQDAWIMRGKVENVRGDFQLGRPLCANRIAYEFNLAGYRLMNPSLSIKSYHIHNSNIRNNNEKEKVDGPTLSVEISAL